MVHNGGVYPMGTGCKDYNFQEMERRWQSFWESNRPFRAAGDPAKPKFYVLDMFPYPSGTGLHIGHPEGYTATDIIARYRRAPGLRGPPPGGGGRFRPPRREARVKARPPPRGKPQKQHRKFRGEDKGAG